jgi:hypothetical protein
MVERADGLPAGVLGFRLPAKVTRDEYQDELMRPIYAALERGEQLNLISPGELRVFTPEEQSAARSWVAGSSAA